MGPTTLGLTLRPEQEEEGPEQGRRAAKGPTLLGTRGGADGKGGDRWAAQPGRWGQCSSRSRRGL